MGLVLNIFRDACNVTIGADPTNGGITGKFNGVTCVNVDGPFAPTFFCPAVLLVDGPVPRTAILVPAERDADGAWIRVPSPVDHIGPIFGGNYASTSDSRFRHAVEEITESTFYGAVAVHDRFEIYGGAQ